MKCYKIKTEYIDAFGDESDENTVLTDSDLEMISRGWEMNIDDILFMVTEIEREEK